MSALCAQSSVLFPFIYLFIDCNPITFSTDQGSLSLPSWLAIIMSKYFVIPSDLFLAAVPGQWYTCLNKLKHAIIGMMQWTYQFSTLISLLPESQASLENSIFCFWLFTGPRHTRRLLLNYLVHGRGDIDLLWTLVTGCPRITHPLISFPWLPVHWGMLLTHVFLWHSTRILLLDTECGKQALNSLVLSIYTSCVSVSYNK